MNDPSTFGIVVPTYNAERTLQRLITSIHRQTCEAYSILIADQKSTDQTAQIARSNGCIVVDIPRPDPFIAWVTPPFPSQSRNIGANLVNGRILLHLDQDMELGSLDFLEKLDLLIDSEHQAVVIREVDVATGFWSTCKGLERSCLYGTQMEGARAVTRELFVRVGGYDQHVSSGEDIFVTRLYERETQLVRHDSLALLHHSGRHSLKWMLTKKFLYGRSAKSYLRRASTVQAPSAGSLVFSSLRAYLKNWRLMLKHPMLYLCIFPLRFMEFSAMQFGMWYGPRIPVASAQASNLIGSKIDDKSG
jgi:glycosyltransferase involved in cell wall biosynthesis